MGDATGPGTPGSSDAPGNCTPRCRRPPRARRTARQQAPTEMSETSYGTAQAGAQTLAASGLRDFRVPFGPGTVYTNSSAPQMPPRFVLELVIQFRQRAERLFGDPGAIGGLVRAWELGQVLTKAHLPRARPQQVMDQQPALGIGQLLGFPLERRVLGQQVANLDPVHRLPQSLHPRSVHTADRVFQARPPELDISCQAFGHTYGHVGLPVQYPGVEAQLVSRLVHQGEEIHPLGLGRDRLLLGTEVEDDQAVGFQVVMPANVLRSLAA